MHQMFRGAARITAIVGLAVSGGVLVAVPPAIADIGADLGLVCSGKAGTHDVALTVATTAPSSATVGQPVQLGTIKLGVDLPSELVKAVQDSSPNGTSTPPVTGVTPSTAPIPAIGGVAEMKVSVHEAGGDRRGGWPAFALAATPARGDGVVHLTGSGVAPPVVAGSPGGLSWSAGEMDLSLVPGDAKVGKESAELALHCVAKKEAVLGTVRVERGNGVSAPGAAAGASPRQPAAAAQSNLCEEIPARGTDPRYGLNTEDPKLKEILDSPDIPPGTYPPVTEAGRAYCLKATGFVNIKKAGNAVPIAIENSARMPVTQISGDRFVYGPNYIEYRGYFVNRTYPTPATVLGFGFMPTRAVAQAVQVAAENGQITGNLRVTQLMDATSALPGPEKSQLQAGAYVRVKAGQAEVNGVPLNLGDKCMTSPTMLYANASVGNREVGLSPYTYGQSIIVEDLNVPAFTGCGVEEDLSPILTASISGPGNYANAESGWWCGVADGSNCVDGAAPLPSTFTIKPGGDFTAVAKPFVLNRQYGTNHSQFRCDSATMKFHMDGAHWQSRFLLAKGDMSAEGCEVVATDGSVYRVIGKVTQENPLWLTALSAANGQVQLRINGVRLNAPVDFKGTRCVLRLAYTMPNGFFGLPQEGPGEIYGYYDNREDVHTFFMTDNLLTPTPASTCNIPGFTQQNLKFLVERKNDFVFPAGLSITSP